MKEIVLLEKMIENYKISLLDTIDNFRKGNDETGLNNFLSSMDNLENLLEPQEYYKHLDINEISLKMNQLYEYIKNQDILGIVDLLEFEIYPNVQKWIERCIE